MMRAYFAYILFFICSVAFLPFEENDNKIGADAPFAQEEIVCSAEKSDSVNRADVVSDYFFAENLGNSGSSFSFRGNSPSANSFRILVRRFSGGCAMALRYSDNVIYNSLFSSLVSSQTHVHFGLLSPERYFISLRKFII